MGYDFVVGDTLSEIAVQFVNQDGTIADISGGSVELQYRILLGDERIPGAAMQRAMTVTDGPGGAARYQLEAADLFEGIMRCEFIITLAGGEMATSLEFTDFLVRARL